MSLLTPLGLLGLIGLIVLLIIYIIKPNYQNKVISSTFVWHLSLRYRKKKIPINKLRNIILIICQVLIISISAFIIAQPFIPEEQADTSSEKILIIDASASMLSSSAGQSRVERAVDRALEDAKKALEEKDQKVSVILATDEPRFLVQELGVDQATLVYDALNSIVDPAAEERMFTYSEPDIDGAIKLAEEITAFTPDVEVLLYTDTTYIDKGKINVVNVSEATDWNAAILDVRAEIVENWYVFEIDVATYGIDSDVRVFCDIIGVNGEGNGTGSNININTVARCFNGQVTTLRFANYDENATDADPDARPDEIVQVYSFENINVRVDESDSLALDNVYFLYGGMKPTLKVQYHSARPNNFFSSALMVLRDQLKEDWNMEITEVKKDAKPEIEGFDIYIFEHVVPAVLPIDGIVIIMDPDQMPAGEMKLSSYWMPFAGSWKMHAEDPHPIMKNITPENIEVSLYRSVSDYGDFIPIMSCEDDPVVFIKDEIDSKMVVMNFDIHYSNFSMILEFPIFMHNIFEYFSPTTIKDHVYEINDTVDLNARGDRLYISGPDVNEDVTEFPVQIKVTEPGVYSASQVLINGEESVENFYVKIPANESNTSLSEDVLTNPFYYEDEENNDLDLLLYFAIALVALLFIEWWLKSREQL